MAQSETAIPRAVLRTELPGLKARGKVRDIYDLGDRLMIVASDRISAFDVVMNEPVPGKGVLLTQMSRFWLETLPACRPHHLEYVVGETRCPAGYEAQRESLRDRAMVVKKAWVLPIECVVRGYIVGGGWKEYRERGSISGVPVPKGLQLAQRLPEPIFTPSTKADVGHDEPISFEQACQLLNDALPAEGPGRPSLSDWLASRLTTSTADWRTANDARGRWLMDLARQRSLDIYTQAAEHAARLGIIIADTKFEFGLAAGPNGYDLLLIDEVLTPDSSRFWPAEQWQLGRNPPSFDKQFLRDYLESTAWNKQPPPPPVPAEVIEQTRQRYAEAHRLLVQ